MLSSRLTEARPVRTPAISCCRSESAFSMRVLAWVSTSLMFWKAWVDAGAEGSFFIVGSMNYSSDGLAHRHTHYIAVDVQIENHDGESVVAAHGHGRGIHDAERLGEHLQVSHFRVTDRLREFQWVLVIDA